MSVAVAPRVIFRRNTPRANGICASSASVFPSTALLVTSTSTPATGTASSSGSSTSSAPAPISSTSTSRGPATATTSPSCSTVSAVASSIVPLRRIRWTKTRASGTIASASTALSPTAFPPCLHAERAQLPAVPGRAGAAQLLGAAVLFLVLLAGRREIDAEQLRARAARSPAPSPPCRTCRSRRRRSASSRACVLASSAGRPSRLMASVERPIAAEIVCEPE